MLTQKAIIMDAPAIDRAVTRICYEIIERNKGLEDIALVGVFTRGAVLAERMSKKLFAMEGVRVPLGKLDITPFRDDLTTEVTEDKSDIPFSVTGKKVVLVDDVIFAGRTIRAAIDAIMSRGRPRGVQLAVLLDRGHRELPIRADYVGKNVPTSHSEQVKVNLLPIDDSDYAGIFVQGKS